MKLDHKAIRIVSIVLLTLALSNSAVYGPGRGMCLIPPDESWSDFIWFTEVVTLLFLIAGTATLKKHRHISSTLLAIGLIGRVVYELKISFLRESFEMRWIHSVHPIWLMLILTYYVAGFALPTLWVIDGWKGRKRQVS